MANTKISALTSATIPLVGTEVLPIVQSGATKQVSVSDFTAGRYISVARLGAGTTNPQKPIHVLGPDGAVAVFPTLGAKDIAILENNANVGYAFIVGAANIAGLKGYISGATTAFAAVNFAANSGVPQIQFNLNNVTQGILDSATNNFKLVSGNFKPDTAGKGIDFTANTSAAGMTSQLLNWYEEGTFTPIATQASSAPTITYTGRSGKYTRVGRVVTAHIEIIIDTVSGGSGATQITGLPYAVNEANYGGQGMFGYNDALANTVYGCWIGSTTVYFRSGTRSSGNDTGGWSAGGYLELTLVYQV